MSDKIEKLQREGIKPVSIYKRAVAMTIDDMLLSFLVFFAFWPELSSAKSYEESIRIMDSLFIYILIIFTLYHWIFVALYSQTIGKMIVKIKVVDIDTLDKPSWINALIRSVFRNFDEMFFGLGMMYAFVDPLNRALHDIIGNSVVVENN